MSLRIPAIVAAAVVVLGILENVLFGSDTPGVRHTISVGFFLLTVVGIVALIGIGIAAVVRRVRLRVER